MLNCFKCGKNVGYVSPGCIPVCSDCYGTSRITTSTSSTFDDFLKEEGIKDEVDLRVKLRMVREQLETIKNSARSSITSARSIGVSNSAFEFVLSNIELQLEEVIKSIKDESR